MRFIHSSPPPTMYSLSSLPNPMLIANLVKHAILFLQRNSQASKKAENCLGGIDRRLRSMIAARGPQQRVQTRAGVAEGTKVAERLHDPKSKEARKRKKETEGELRQARRKSHREL